VVAVFDTWPVRQLTNVRAPALNGNPSLQAAVANQLATVVDCLAGVPPGGLPCGQYLLGNPSPILPPYDMSDHGLFITDVIKDIAPNAEVRVYRVMTDEGVGDLDVLSQAVRDAIDYVGQEQRDKGLERPRPLVLNFSLGIAPQLLLLKQLWNDPGRYYQNPRDLIDAINGLKTPVTPPSPNQPEPVDSEVATLRDGGFIARDENRFTGVLGPVEKIFSFGGLERVLAIAASGNDSAGDRRRFGPRLPAACEGVLAVSAVAGTQAPPRGFWARLWRRLPSRGSNRRPLRASYYSNIDDFFADNDGISAVGGEAMNGQSSTNATTALVGLYASENVPPGSTTVNDAGWAAWSGTSFAAPVAVGFAAALWSEQPDLSALQVRKYILYDPATKQDRDVLPFVQQ